MSAVLSSQKHPKVFFANLDGLRFFAFLVVFVSHAALFLGYEENNALYLKIKKYVLINGDIGVSFFFVLSGFLISYLLFTEQDHFGKINLWKFYKRRILRIWPVYFITLITGFFILPPILHFLLGSFGLPYPVLPHLPSLPSFLVFLGNFTLAFHGTSGRTLDVLWSISVEEQFYLVWPWVVSFLPRTYIPYSLGLVITLSCLYRLHYAGSPEVLGVSTFSVMSDLAIGCLLAWALYYKKGVIALLHRIPKPGVALLYLLTATVIIGRHYLTYVSVENVLVRNLSAVFVPLVLAILFALIIFEQNESIQSFFKAKELKLFSFLGTISYGFYAYHMIAMSLVIATLFKLGVELTYESIPHFIVVIILSFALSFGMAYLSYRYIEKWFLKRKVSV